MKKKPKKISLLMIFFTVSFSRFTPSRTMCLTSFRKSLMSVKFLPVILGPEMAAPILWAPGIFWFFLLENPHAHKILVLGGGRGRGFFWKGGVEVPISCLWAWGFFQISWEGPLGRSRPKFSKTALFSLVGRRQPSGGL